MGKLLSITQHKNYTPNKVRADLYYGIDINLDENARALYNFLWCVAKRRKDTTGYLPWESTDTAMGEILRSEFGRDLSMSSIKHSFSLLRKNRYLRFTYDFILKARILELLEHIGQSATS